MLAPVQLSAEVRWFAAGPVPTALDAWFAEAPFGVGGGVERSDLYLAGERGDELGLKQRDGRPGVEVKALVDPAATTLSVAGTVARVQLWTKCRSDVLVLRHLPTVTLCKRRSVRKLDTSGARVCEAALGAGASREEPLDGRWPAVGCNVELTRVRVGERTFCSLGAEAFALGRGSESLVVMIDALRRTFAHLEAKRPLPSLAGFAEQSYPAWLRGLA